MFIRLIFLTTALTGYCCAAVADSGTPAEQAACRPDVRRFCGDLTPDADDSAYLTCLENHRDALSKKCFAVLNDHGR